MPDNNIEWGQGAVNNDIGWGKGASNNSISWGAITADSPSGDTNLIGASSGFPSISNTKSLGLDGVNDYASFTETNFMNSNNESSYSFWIKPNTYVNGYGYFIGGSTSSRGGFAYSEGGTGGSHSPGQIYYYSGSAVKFTGVILTENVWSHLVFVFESGFMGGTLKTYLNGSLANTTTGITFGPLSNLFDRIGNLGGFGHYVNGKMDEFATWSSALTAENVSSIYNSGVPNDISSLNPVFWYRMEFEMFSQTGNDGSSNEILTLQNGATLSTDVPS